MSRTSFSGPVSGAYMSLSVSASELVTNTTYTWPLQLPAGMTARLIEVTCRASGVAGNPQLTVGNTTDTDGIRSAITLTTNLGELTLDGALMDSNDRYNIPAGGQIRVILTNDAVADAVEALSIQCHVHVTAHATNTDER